MILCLICNVKKIPVSRWILIHHVFLRSLKTIINSYHIFMLISSILCHQLHVELLGTETFCKQCIPSNFPVLHPFSFKYDALFFTDFSYVTVLINFFLSALHQVSNNLQEYLRFKQKKGWRRLAVYKSGIHALGLYTMEFIAEGEVVRTGSSNKLLWQSKMNLQRFTCFLIGLIKYTNYYTVISLSLNYHLELHRAISFY